MRYVVTTLVALMIATSAFANDAYEDISVIDMPGSTPQAGPIATLLPDLIFDNGPYSNWICPTDDESYIEPAGCSTYGFGFQLPLGYWIADDFTVGSSATIESIEFFGYQTSATFPTINDVSYRIYNGQPGAGGTMICEVTGALNSIAWAEGPFTLGRVFRTNGQGVCTNARIIQSAMCNPPAPGPCNPLPAGTYWIAVQMNGSGSSGPWCPVVVPGEASDNALQSLDSGSTWAPMADTGCGLVKDIPFRIYGPTSTPVEASTWGQIKQTF